MRYFTWKLELVSNILWVIVALASKASNLFWWLYLDLQLPVLVSQIIVSFSNFPSFVFYILSLLYHLGRNVSFLSCWHNIHTFSLSISSVLSFENVSMHVDSLLFPDRSFHSFPLTAFDHYLANLIPQHHKCFQQ